MTVTVPMTVTATTMTMTTDSFEFLRFVVARYFVVVMSFSSNSLLRLIVLMKFPAIVFRAR